MAWRAYFRTDNGRLISVATVFPAQTPVGMDYIENPILPNMRNWMWDTTQRTFVARPPKVLIDRLTDLTSHPRFADFVLLVWSNLNATQRSRVRTVLVNWLGRARWRNPTDTETVEPDDA